MNNIILMFFVMFAITARATTSLSALNTRPYEKPIYEEALKYAINSAVPLDKQSFTVTVDGKKLGDLITGQGLSENGTNICFVSRASTDGRISTLIPTIDKDNWEAEVCNRPEKCVTIFICRIIPVPNSVTSLQTQPVFLRPTGFERRSPVIRKTLCDLP